MGIRDWFKAPVEIVPSEETEALMERMEEIHEEGEAYPGEYVEKSKQLWQHGWRRSGDGEYESR